MFKKKLDSYKRLIAFQYPVFCLMEGLKLFLSFTVVILFGSFPPVDLVSIGILALAFVILSKVIAKEKNKQVYASEVWAAFLFVFLLYYFLTGGLTPLKIFAGAAVVVLSGIRYYLMPFLKDKAYTMKKEVDLYYIPLHEVAHYVVNERLGVFVSDFICLVPSERAAGFFRPGKLLLKDTSFPFNYMCLLLAGYVACEHFGFNKNCLSHEALLKMLETELTHLTFRPGYKEKLLARFNKEGYSEKVYKRVLEVLNEEKDKIFAMCDLILGKDKIDCSWLEKQYSQL